MLAILSQPNHHISEQEQVHISTDKIAEPAAMTQALCCWHSNLFVPAVQPLPEVKVGFNWSPNFTRQIRKPHPTITDSIADLMQVLLWNDITDTASNYIEIPNALHTQSKCQTPIQILNLINRLDWKKLVWKILTMGSLWLMLEFNPS